MFCIQNDNIVVNSPSPIIVSTSFTNNTCENFSDGSITVEAIGGSNQFLYSLFGPPGFSNIVLSPNPTFENLPAGNYFVFINDLGCGVPEGNTYPVNISFDEYFTISLIDQEYDCQSQIFNNIISVNGDNISYPLSIDITNLTTGDILNLNSNEDVISIDQLESGFYDINITSNNGCQNSLTLVVDEYTPLNATVTTPSESLVYSGFDLSCSDAEDGWINVEVTGGYGNYTYTWSDGSSTQNLENLSEGLYSLVISDEYGCSINIEEELIAPELFEASVVTTNVSCNNLSDGEAELIISGGIPPYSNVLSQLSNLAPGTYSEIITDLNGCQIPIEYDITEPDQITVSVIQSDYSTYGVLCNGSNNGFIDITVEGGTGLYSYSWSNGSNSEDLTGIGPGTYDLIVSDENGCDESVSITISEPDILSISSTQSNFSGFGISCNGESDGFIDITVSGGTGNYSYAWNNGSISEDLSNINAGTYDVIVTDENGCVVQSSFFIDQPDPLIISSVLSDFTGYGISCYGENNGSIDITVSGGVEPYSYSWNNGETTQDLVNLSSGTYELTVLDSQNCISSSVQFEIDEPDDIFISYLTSSYNGYGLSASNSSDGFIDITVTGGTGTYTFSWNNGETTEDLIDIGEGTYSLIATDSNNCFEELLDFEITAPPPITLSISTPLLGWDFENGFETNLSYGASDGSIDLNVTGGQPPYIYEWTNSNGEIISNDEDIFDLSADTYFVSVTDDNSVTENNPPIVITQPSAFTVNYEIIPPLCGEELAEFTILEIDGSTDPSNEENFEDPNADNGWYYAFNLYFGDDLINWAFNNELPLTFQFDPTAYGDGTYTMLISHTAAGFDNPGICSQSYTFELENISPINIDNSQIIDASCGLDNGSIQLSFSGGDGVYEYDWTGPNGFTSTDNNLFNLSPGIYNLLVNDGSGCDFSDSFEIQGTDGLNILSEQISNTCVGSSLGSITIEVSGGSGNYTFSLFDEFNSIINTNSTGVFNGLSIGVYYVEVFDPQCDPINSSILSVDNLSTLFATLDSESSTLGVCSGQPTGFLDINVTGGQPFPDGNYAYVWTASNGGIIPQGQETNQDISDLLPGDYSVYVFDDSGCHLLVLINIQLLL